MKEALKEETFKNAMKEELENKSNDHVNIVRNKVRLVAHGYILVKGLTLMRRLHLLLAWSRFD